MSDFTRICVAQLPEAPFWGGPLIICPFCRHTQCVPQQDDPPELVKQRGCPHLEYYRAETGTAVYRMDRAGRGRAGSRMKAINKELGAAAREPLDYYPTNPDFARAACRTLRDELGYSPRTVLDPGCGAGAWGRAVKEVWPGASVYGVEIEPGRSEEAVRNELGVYAAVAQADFTAWSPPEGWPLPFDLVIGNPPYRQAEEFVRSAGFRGWSVAFLVKASFWCGGQARHKDLFADYPPTHAYHIPRRPYPGHAEEYVFLVWNALAMDRKKEEVIWW